MLDSCPILSQHRVTFMSSLMIYDLIIAAWLSGSQLTYDPKIGVMDIAPSEFKTGCPIKDSEPTVFYWDTEACHTVLKAVTDARTIVIDRNNDIDPEYVFKYVNGKGWTRAK